MLRGVIGLSVSVTGTLVFDNFKMQLLRVTKGASGDMLSAHRMLARDQVLAEISGRFSLRESADSGSNNRRHSHDSQPLILRAHKRAVYTISNSVPPGARPH